MSDETASEQTTEKTDLRQAIASYLCSMFYAHESGEPDEYLDMADHVLSIVVSAEVSKDGMFTVRREKL